MAPVISAPALAAKRSQASSDAPPQPSPKPDVEKTREVRLGLVLYGGVSLAIYINGVCQEFFHAVRGRGVYKLIKALTDSEVTVDVVSGTSAGGINGILLAYALCNDRDFADSSSLWRRDGGIRQLLRDPMRDNLRRVSVLDSEGYYQPALEAAFKYMGPYAAEPGEEHSPISELDLFVTGTDVDGNIYTAFDDAGHPIDVKDHRTVFRLKHRAGRKEPFNPRPSGLDPAVAGIHAGLTYESLAKLARLTSCFPAAFAPVRVQLQTDTGLSADARLQEWGRLGKDTCFLDGGVLDNKPFTHTLGAIFSRAADRAVDRKLFYVEPDPESFQQRVQATEPDFFQAVVSSMIGIPGYESISDDLQAITEHNNKVHQFRRIVAYCVPTDEPERAGDTSAAKRLDSETSLYQRSRMVALSDRVIEGLLRRNGRSDVLGTEERRAATALIESFENAVKDPEALFQEFDLYYRVRRHHHAIYRIYDRLYGKDQSNGAGEQLTEVYRKTWRALNGQVKLLAIIQAAMERIIDEAPIEWRGRKADDIWTDVMQTLRVLLDDPVSGFGGLPKGYPAEKDGKPAAWLDEEALKGFNKAISERAKDIVEAVRDRTFGSERTDAADAEIGRGRPNLLERVDTYAQAIVEAHLSAGDPVRIAYERFASLDRQLFPVELASGLREKVVVQTVRISPRDAERGFSRRGFSDKVAGDALYHFGGFFKRSWRSNDILWGRLDGLCQLVESLLPAERLREVTENPNLRRKIRARLFSDAPGTVFRPELDPAALFPHAGGSTQDKLAKWLRALLADDDAVRHDALCLVPGDGGLVVDNVTFANTVELLIEAAQLEVIDNDLPNVITDAIEEQSEWFEVPILTAPAPKDSRAPDSWVFKPLEPGIDPFVATVAAAERMRAAMGDLTSAGEDAPTPRRTALGRFFDQSYQVGKERLTSDIPPSVLLELLSIALLLVRDCVLTGLGERGERIRRTFLYRTTVALPLRTFHLLLTRRRFSRMGRILFWVVAVVSLAALLWAGWSIVTFLKEITLPPQPRWSLLIPVGVAGFITFVGLAVIFSIKRKRFTEYEPSVSIALTVPEEKAWVDASFTADCKLRPGRLNIQLRGGMARVGRGDGMRLTTKIRSLRLVLATDKDRPDGVASTYRTDGDWTRVARSGKVSIEREIGPDESLPMGTQKLSIKLEQGIKPERHWLAVEMDVERGQRVWWRPWRLSERTVCVVHACRRLASREDVENGTPAGGGAGRSYWEDDAAKQVMQAG